MLLLWASTQPALEAVAQTPERYVQAGVAVVPGLGIQAGYVRMRSLYTVEALSYVDATPRFGGGEGNIHVSGGLGGSLRVLGILRAVGSPAYVGRDLDVGLRFGPSLTFTYGDSPRARNPFSLFLEPFVRATSNFNGGRVYFIEVGLQRPLLRAGLFFEL